MRYGLSAVSRKTVSRCVFVLLLAGCGRGGTAQTGSQAGSDIQVTQVNTPSPDPTPSVLATSNKAQAELSSSPLDAAEANKLAQFLDQAQYKEGLEWLKSFGHGGAEEQRYAGLFHHGLAQPDETLSDLVPVFRAHPADDVVALAIAEASLWKKDYKTATTLLGQLRSADAPEALRVKGLLFEQAGRLTEALEAYDRAIPQLKLPWGTLERKAQVLSWLKRFDEARNVYAQVANSTAASIALRQRCRVRMAEITAWNKDFDGALDQLNQLLQETPRSVDALLLKGQIMEWQGQFTDAKRIYSSILEFEPSQADARLRLDKLLWVK
ncbi:MAG TPA: tetratricopeptide repeat protein [Polyangiaceae bacterium]|nr:tetratricopeptide repeat protein [Polyangiaceae bacterium]